MAYTKILKPTGTTYTPLSSGSTYDDTTDAYDTAASYDGAAVDYTPVTKPTTTMYTKLTKPV